MNNLTTLFDTHSVLSLALAGTATFFMGLGVGLMIWSLYHLLHVIGAFASMGSMFGLHDHKENKRPSLASFSERNAEH